MPVEKKKKGKRRNQEVQEGGESDDTASMSALNMGGEDSQDALDNSVSRQGRPEAANHNQMNAAGTQRKCIYV